MTFDILLFRGRIHGDALTKVDVMIDFFDFFAVDSTGFFYVLSELVVIALVFFRFILSPTSRLAWLSSCSISWSSLILLVKIIMSTANRR